MGAKIICHHVIATASRCQHGVGVVTLERTGHVSRFFHRVRVGIAALVVPAAVVACGGAEPAQSAQLTVALEFAPKAGFAIDTDDAFVLSKLGVTETLVAPAPDGTVAPRLATSWTQVDPRIWRFELRDGVTFQDGTPLTPDAVVTAVTYVTSVATPPRSVKGLGLRAAADGPPRSPDLYDRARPGPAPASDQPEHRDPGTGGLPARFAAPGQEHRHRTVHPHRGQRRAERHRRPQRHLLGPTAGAGRGAGPLHPRSDRPGDGRVGRGGRPRRRDPVHPCRTTDNRTTWRKR